MSVEVAGGPTLGLKAKVKLSVFLTDESEEREERDEIDTNGERRSGFFLDDVEEEEEGEKSENSSIGVASSCSSLGERENGGEEEEEVQSKEREKGSLSSLDSLEESLPIKRGLSNFYSGKSKSFASLSNASSSNIKDLAKPENPFNKRRRILVAWSRRASYSSLITASSLPPLFSSDHTVEETEETEESEETEEKIEEKFVKNPPKLAPIWNNKDHTRDRNRLPLRSPRSFSLSDLNQHA